MRTLRLTTVGRYKHPTLILGEGADGVVDGAEASFMASPDFLPGQHVAVLDYIRLSIVGSKWIESGARSSLNKRFKLDPVQLV
jgi:hypothetical protein